MTSTLEKELLGEKIMASNIVKQIAIMT